MRILLAIDGSEIAGKAVDYVVKHRAFFGQSPEITCVYVEKPVALRMVGAFGTDPGMPPTAPADPEQLVAPALQTLADAGLKATLLVDEGDAGLEIAQLAQDGNYDMIVIGSHGRSLFKRALLGSVASKVIASCTVPVLVIR
jgi:nucleotide-binding universal stress UspA family protein